MWYKSTVLDVRESKTNNDTKTTKEVYVAYRVYEEEGHKVDE